MLLSIVKEFEAAQSRLAVGPYKAWSDAARQFRDDWEKGNCAHVGRLHCYLEDIPQDQRFEVLLDLISEHLQRVWQAGPGTDLQPYLLEFAREFENFAQPTAVPASLVEDEFLARYAFPHGDTPTVAEYQDRFPNRPDVMSLLRRRCLDQGRYVILHELGRGAMGVVFEAYDHYRRRLVAIKQPRPGVMNAGHLHHRLAEEARLTARLEHPAIVTVHEHCDDEDRPFYVMRLIRGRPLGEHIRDFHLPPIERSRGEQQVLWSQLLQIFAKVCEAIAFAHDRGVLHRDLKPDNVLVDPFDEIAILDWGLAKPIPCAGDHSSGYPSDKDRELKERADMVVGTPQYMPPEQADGVSDARSDVFGLGAILYEMLTATSPHSWPEGARPLNWLQIVRSAQFPRPRRLKTKISRRLEAICLKATNRDPKDRYQNVAELHRDLLRHLGGKRESGKKVPAPYRAVGLVGNRKLE